MADMHERLLDLERRVKFLETHATNSDCINGELTKVEKRLNKTLRSIIGRIQSLSRSIKRVEKSLGVLPLVIVSFVGCDEPNYAPDLTGFYDYIGTEHSWGCMAIQLLEKHGDDVTASPYNYSVFEWKHVFSKLEGDERITLTSITHPDHHVENDTEGNFVLRVPTLDIIDPHKYELTDSSLVFFVHIRHRVTRREFIKVNDTYEKCT